MDHSFMFYSQTVNRNCTPFVCEAQSAVAYMFNNSNKSSINKEVGDGCGRGCGVVVKEFLAFFFFFQFFTKN